MQIDLLVTLQIIIKNSCNNMINATKISYLPQHIITITLMLSIQHNNVIATTDYYYYYYHVLCFNHNHGHSVAGISDPS